MAQIIDIKVLIELLFSEIFAQSVERHHEDYVTERHTLKADLDPLTCIVYLFPYTIISLSYTVYLSSTQDINLHTLL